MRAVIDRDGMVRSISYSACFAPYQNEKRRARIVPGCSVVGGAAGDRPATAGGSIGRALTRTVR
jgi:hypothetical protein